MSGYCFDRWFRKDIKINNDPRKRSKAPIIIAAIVLFAVVIGFTVWVVMNNLGSQTQIEENTTAQQAKNDFTQYATYLLLGKKEDELPGAYSADRFYTLDEKLTNDEVSNLYWGDLLEQLDTSITTFNSASVQDQYLSNYLENHRQNMIFLNVYRQLDMPSDEYIIGQYVENGKEKTLSVIREYLLPLVNLDQRSSAKTYYDYKMEQYSSYLDAIQEYSNAGCLADSSVNEECAASLAEQLDSPVVTFLETSIEMELNAQSAIDDTLRAVESDCWRINAQFNELIKQTSGSEEEYEKE